jgi:hypothetical protein
MIILKSLLITVTLSALIGYGLKNILGFWEAFCIALALQTIISFIFSSLRITKEQTIIDTYQAEIDNLADMCTTTIECPCGKQRIEDMLFVGIENMFECELCGSKFKADINITPTLLTEPVDNNKTFDELIKKQKEL